jgi:hypothetical protein
LHYRVHISTDALSQDCARSVHGQSCVASGVEADCLVVKDSGSGVLYNLPIVGTGPKVGQGIEFTAVPYDGLTMCKEGAPVKVTQGAQKDSINYPPNETPVKGWAWK